MRTVVESSFSVGLLVLVPTLDSLRKPCWTGALWTGYLPISGSPWMCSFGPGSLATNSRMLPGFGSDDGSESWRTQICKGANIEKKVDDEPASCATIACTYSKPFQSFNRVLYDGGTKLIPARGTFPVWSNTPVRDISSCSLVSLGEVGCRTQNTSPLCIRLQPR